MQTMIKDDWLCFKWIYHLSKEISIPLWVTILVGVICIALISIILTFILRRKKKKKDHLLAMDIENDELNEESVRIILVEETIHEVPIDTQNNQKP